MSSSNLIALYYIPETSYGVTPPAGNFSTARYTSEKLSASPNTTESKQIRTDRMNSGQVVTGLGVGGQLSFELAKEAALEDFMSSAMYNPWSVFTLQTTAMTYDSVARTITRSAGSFIADGIVIGDFLTLGGFTSPLNNQKVLVADIVSATVIRIVGPTTMISGSGTTTTYLRADKLTIGTTKKSFSFQKTFLDLTSTSLIYKGMIVNAMELNVQYGSLIEGSFTFVANDAETTNVSTSFITNARTITPPATSTTFNGSIDMPYLANSALGALDETTLEIESIKLTLNNNLAAQNVIGAIAPIDYSAGTAAIAVSLTAYFTDAAYPILQKKLSQIPFELGFLLDNPTGAYGFYMPAIQVSFDDPSSGGQNQDVKLDMNGNAKVGPNGESSLCIYRFN